MKKDEIKVGGTYLAKVTDRVVPVRLDRENARGGWDATNLVTNKQVRIKSAQRLRGPAERATPAKADAAQRTKAMADAHVTDAKANAPSTPEAPAKKTAKPRTPKADKAAKVKKTSGLDAAYQVLGHTGEPMRCGDMVEKMLATGLWKTDGKTPAATIYAAILREIQTKGSAARFKKTDRGLFTVNGK